MKQYQKEIEELKKLLEEGSEDITATDDDCELSDAEIVNNENENVEINGNESSDQGSTKSSKRNKTNTIKKKIIKRSAAELLEIKTKIEEEKKRLVEEKDMAEEERKKLADNLAQHESALATAQVTFWNRPAKGYEQGEKLVSGSMTFTFLFILTDYYKVTE